MASERFLIRKEISLNCTVRSSEVFLQTEQRSPGLGNNSTSSWSPWPYQSISTSIFLCISAHSLLLGLVVKIEGKCVKTSEPAAARCILLVLFLLSGSNQTLTKPSGKASVDFGDCPELLPQTWDRCVVAQMNFPQRQPRFVSSWAPPAPREALSFSLGFSGSFGARLLLGGAQPWAGWGLFVWWTVRGANVEIQSCNCLNSQVVQFIWRSAQRWVWNNNAVHFLGAFHLSKYLLISSQNTPARQIRDGRIRLLSRTGGPEQLSGCIKQPCPQFGAD